MKQKLLSLVLSLIMGLAFVPAAGTGEASAAAGGAPNESVFLDTDGLINAGQGFAKSRALKNPVVVELGTDDEGNGVEWYLLSEDSGVEGRNAVLFGKKNYVNKYPYSKEGNGSTKTYSYGANEGYGNEAGSIVVKANHYGASDAYKYVCENAPKMFSDFEYALLNDTAVTTRDIRNDLDYTTTGKFYFPATACDNGTLQDVIMFGSSNQLVYKGSMEFLSSGEEFLFRTPFKDNITVYSPSLKGANTYGLPGSYNIRLTTNLNLDNEYFVSAAQLCTSGTNVTVCGDIEKGTSMKIRLLDSSARIGSVVYDSTGAASDVITAVKDENAKGDVFLYVQGFDGTKNWYYSTPVEGSISVTADEVRQSVGASNISLPDCEVWLELATEDTGRIRYAVYGSPATYPVKLETGGGTLVNMSITEYTTGSSVELPTESSIILENHTFLGWYDNAKYTGEPVTEISTTDVGPKTFYVKWEHKRTAPELTKSNPKSNGRIAEVCVDCGAVTSSTPISRPSKVKLNPAEYTYNGKERTPKVSVTDAAGKTIPASEYSYMFESGRKNVGRYKVTVTFKETSERYEGTMTAYLKINPKGAVISSAVGSSKAITVKWKPQTERMSESRITGYQIRYSTSKNFSKVKRMTVTRSRTSSAKIRWLKSGKRYYLQLRTYKKKNGQIYYSTWSKTRTAVAK